MDTVMAMRSSIEVEAQTAVNLVDNLDYSVLEALVHAIVDSPMILTSGAGTSGIAADKLSHSLACVEQDAYYLRPDRAASGGLGLVKPGTLVILVSNGGETEELYVIARVAKSRGATLALITAEPESTLADASDLVVLFEAPRESDPLDIMSTASFIATICVCDALLSGVIAQTGYTRNQFGRIHPSGAVGIALNESGPEHSGPFSQEEQGMK